PAPVRFHSECAHPEEGVRVFAAARKRRHKELIEHKEHREGENRPPCPAYICVLCGKAYSSFTTIRRILSPLSILSTTSIPLVPYQKTVYQPPRGGCGKCFKTLCAPRVFFPKSARPTGFP